MTIGLHKLDRDMVRSANGLLGLVFCLLFLAATFAPAPVHAVDYRIIFIDNALYSSIQNTDERRRALDHLLADISMFEQPEHAASIETVLFLRGGQRGDFIDQALSLPAEGKAAQALAETTAFQDMQAGSVSYQPGVDIHLLRSRIHGFLGKFSKGSVDIHIFAASWSAGQSSLRSVMEELLPSACVSRDDPSPTLVPDGIEISIELRAPENAKQPSEAAVANLITLISGTSEQRPNVRSRGAAGPLCPMQDAVVAVGYDPDPNGSASLDCVALPLPSAPSPYRACRAPLVPAIGVLDRTPIRLVAADRDISLDAAGLQVLVAPPGFDVEVKIADVSIPSRGVVSLSGTVSSGVYEAWLELTPAASCSTANGTDLRVEDGNGHAMQVVTSRISCLASRLRLSDVRVP